MTRLSWNQEGQNQYEFGVDHGVFYPVDGPGVVWNGLVSVDEESIGGEAESYYYDGNKYMDLALPSNYASTITAYSAPAQFSVADGERSVIPGFILTRQGRSRFGLSYRTFVGGSDYKIHIVYNALTSTDKRTHETMSDNANPTLFSWKINAVPPPVEGYRPSAHYILDSRLMADEVLKTLEDILYGSDKFPPRLPLLDELISISTQFVPLIIVEQLISGLANLVPGMGDLYRTEPAGIHRGLPNTRLIPTPIQGLYRLE